MTIAQPNRQQQLTRVLRLLFLAIAVSGIVSIFFYNQMVSKRTAFREITKTVEQLRLSGVELKNEYYVKLDNKNLLETASELGYVKEANPRYLRLDSPVALTN